MQTELFEMTPTSSPESSLPVVQPSFLEKTVVTLRLDQAIGVFLVILVFYVLAFSWGVEKGKHVAQHIRVSASLNTAANVISEGSSLPASEQKPAVSVSSIKPVFSEPVATVIEPPVLKQEPAAEVAKSKPEGKYTVQHVTYVTQSAADREVQRLVKAGQNAFALRAGKYFLVCIDAFQTQQEASRFLRQLKTQHRVSVDAYVRAIPV